MGIAANPFIRRKKTHEDCTAADRSKIALFQHQIGSFCGLKPGIQPMLANEQVRSPLDVEVRNHPADRRLFLRLQGDDIFDKVFNIVWFQDEIWHRLVRRS